MIPPVSPFGLIQETLWPNKWMILVVSMMLNQTQRKQVEKVLPEFRKRWPTPEKFTQAKLEEVIDVIRPLGFYNRRSANLIAMTIRYLKGDWKDVRELPGVGQYAARSWEIFCENNLGNEPPVDHALVIYWTWASQHSI